MTSKITRRVEEAGACAKPWSTSHLRGETLSEAVSEVQWDVEAKREKSEHLQSSNECPPPRCWNAEIEHGATREGGRRSTRRRQCLEESLGNNERQFVCLGMTQLDKKQRIVFGFDLLHAKGCEEQQETTDLLSSKISERIYEGVEDLRWFPELTTVTGIRYCTLAKHGQVCCVKKTTPFNLD